MGHGDEDEPLAEGRTDEDDDEGPNDAPRSAVPDPLDRLWRHPTELPLSAGFAAGTPAAPPTRRRARSWLVPLAAGAAGALVTLVVLAAAGAFHKDSPAEPTVTATAAPEQSPSAQDIAARVGVSVVTIVAHDGTGTRRGSGVCVRHGGELLTTARLVGNATSVDVFTSDGQRHSAHIVGRDRTTDLVLLAVDSGAVVPAAQLANNTPATGTGVWVVGAPSPGTNAAWMSTGILSSNNVIVATLAGPMTSGLIETDALTSEAAAGGALVDHSGSVVGIVLDHVDTNGTTYAVPINNAVAVANQLHDNGVADHGTAGFAGNDTAHGPTVASVTAGGPAARAGIRSGDVVDAVDGRAVDSMDDIEALVRGDEPGQPVTFDLTRGDDHVSVRVVLGSTPG
jgi:putative serine protease PepD